jgi:hypothetical protein
MKARSWSKATRILALLGLVLPAMSGTSRAAVSYTNSLTNVGTLLSDFSDYSTIDSDYINTLSGGSFTVDPAYGLQLLSTAPNYVEGIGAYNRVLAASNDWTITIQSHISAFTNSQTNPYYSAGISLVKTSSNGLEYPNRVDLNLLRTGAGASTLSNSVVSSLFVQNGETDMGIGKNLTDVFLRFGYKASTRTLATSYSTNGSNFTNLQSYNLGTVWGLKSTDGLTLGVAASDQPDGRAIPTFSITSGQIYLKNLQVTSPNAAASNSPSAATSSTGGTLSLGGNGGSIVTINGAALSAFNNYQGSVTLETGTLNFNTNATMNSNGVVAVVNGSVMSYTNGVLNLGNGMVMSNGVIINTNTINTNTITNTNTIGGNGTPPFGGGTFGGSGVLTNSNSIPGGIGSSTLPPGGQVILVTSLSNIPSSLYSSNGAVVQIIGGAFYTNVNGTFVTGTNN